MTHLYGALGDTTYSRDVTDTAAKSYPFGSTALHLLPFEHLRNLVATHPAAVGVEWSSHVGPVLCRSSLSADMLHFRQAACPC